MTDTPPDEPSGRPPISSFDVPIDESGADEVEQKREQRRNEAALPVAAVEALKLKGLGFSILPLPTEKKAPPPKDWEKASQNNPAVFLKNPGTHNYAVLPPPGVFGWDVDKEAPGVLTAVGNALGEYLPETLMTLTPNGKHLFFKWPLVERPRGPMFGQVVTRWPLGEGQGYLVGPGSVVVQENGTLGVYQAVGLDDDDPIAELPRSWAEAAMHYKPVREREVKAGPLAVVGPHYELPEAGYSGSRYDAIRDYVASYYNRGLSRDALWGAVQAELAPLFAEPLTVRELKERFERTVRDIEERLGPPAVRESTDYVSVRSAPVAHGDATGAEPNITSQASGEGKEEQALFVAAVPFAEELRLREPIKYLVPGWVPAAGFTVFSGHPKSMKSMALLQMLGVFVAGGEWMGVDIPTDDVRVGLYLTREGSHAEMLARTDALIDRHGAALGNRLRFAYEQPIEFDAPSYQRVSEYLAEVESEMSVLPGKLRVMLVLDPLRDLMPGDGDENEAKTMALVKRWCRSLIADYHFLAVVVVHHNRKSATTLSGLEMAGSGALGGAVDGTIIWQAKSEELSDDDERLVVVAEMFGKFMSRPRGEAAFSGRWRYDVPTGLIVPGVGRVETLSGRAVMGTAVAGVMDALRGVGVIGASAKVVGELTGISETNARVQLNRLRDKGKAVKEAGSWYADGFAPHQQPDVILPMAEEPGAPSAEGDDDPDGEVWVDPLHRLD